MNTIVLSPKYQIVIPKKVRESLSLKAGDQFQIVAYDNRIELIPIEDIKGLKGFLPIQRSNT